MPLKRNEFSIDYLVRCKFPALERIRVPISLNSTMGLTPEDRAERERTEASAKKYEAELRQLDPEGIKALVNAEKVKEAALAAIRAEQGERNRSFNSPASAAKFDYWSASPYWSIDEGVALLLSRDPRKVTWESVRAFTNVSTFAARFAEIRELATRAQAAKVITAGTAPGVFLRWAERSGIEVPSALQEAVRARGIAIVDWQDAYSGERARAERLDAELAASAAALATLMSERDALALDLAQKPLGTWPWGEWETSFLRHLAAAAQEFWKDYDPTKPKSAPLTKVVVSWLVERQVPKRVAQIMAQILRDDKLPAGRRR